MFLTDSDGDEHEKPSKKDLLMGRRKDKKDSKKDRGYAALAGESSPDEDADTKYVSGIEYSVYGLLYLIFTSTKSHLNTDTIVVSLLQSCSSLIIMIY